MSGSVEGPRVVQWLASGVVFYLAQCDVFCVAIRVIFFVCIIIFPLALFLSFRFNAIHIIKICHVHFHSIEVA